MTTVDARVLSGAEVAVPTPCWLWRGATTSDGYGLVSDGTGVVGVHRLAYESGTGRTIPDGWQIDHLCMNTRCVNPDHLEAVPQSENRRRQTWWRTHCPAGHPYSEENTAKVRAGGRRCRTCQRQWQRESNARRAAAKAVGA